MSVDPHSIESLPPSVLEAYPAASPPPGVTPNFTNPPSLVPAIVSVGSSFLALALFCFCTRIYTKLYINRKVTWDVLTCSLGFFFALAYYIALCFGCIHGDVGRHMWDLHLSQELSHASLAEDYITTVTSPPALCLIKSTLFIQYYMIFWPLRWVRISVWIGATISTIFYVAVTLSAFVLNSPWPGETWIEAILSPRYLKFANFSVPIGVIGMIIDWYLIILPIRAVATLQMHRSKKVGLVIVFLTGAIASVASTVGLYYRVQVQRSIVDVTWQVSYLHIWGQIEMFAGIACASMSTLHKSFDQPMFKTESLKSLLRQNPFSSKQRSKNGHERIATSSETHRGTTANAHTSSGGWYEMQNTSFPVNRASMSMPSDTLVHLTHEVSVCPEERKAAVQRPA